MSATGRTSDVDRVKDALPSLEDYITSRGRHTCRLDGHGAEKRANHPVHGSEAGGNLSVNTRNGSWYCHRHGSGGGILEWIAVDRGICDCEDVGDLRSVFPEVLRESAAIAGVPLNMSGMDEAELAAWRKERDTLDRVYRAAAEFYAEAFTTTPVPVDGITIDTWVSKKYGLSKSYLAEQLVGFAPPEGDALLRWMTESGFTEEELLSSGLVIKTKAGPKDFFAGRIVFPYWEAGRPRYFIGRKTALTPDVDWEAGKYKKLPTADRWEYISTLVSEPVYGRDSVKNHERVIVTEGITDCMVLHDNGFAAVAPVTTRFKESRVEEVARSLAGKDITVIMDEDPESRAGLMGATQTALTLDTRTTGEVSVGRLPHERGEAVDVASYFAAGGTREGIIDVIHEAVPAGPAAFMWGGAEPVALFEYAVSEVGHDTGMVAARKNADGDTVYLSVRDVLGDVSSLRKAYLRFERSMNANTALLDGRARVGMYEVVMWYGLAAEGEVFQTDGGELYYFEDATARIIRVDGGRRTYTREFENHLHRTFGLSSDTWGRTAFENLRNRMVETRVVPTNRFAHYHEDRGVLYISDFDRGYYKLDGETVEHQRNGEETFFLPNDAAESYRYLSPSEREEFGSSPLPGERPTWCGAGDLVHRFITNRVNYSEDAALSPTEQRAQLYLHLHAIPFGSVMMSRPIMAWVGEKGSGKTYTLRAIGQFLFGPEYRERRMPPEEEDFAATVANNSLAFFDNYDDGVAWANDALAAVSTGAPITRRELYTTSDEKVLDTDCWLGITSRTPPFRRDDVADRCLVFRVERLDSFVSSGEFYGVLAEYRDSVWSEYLDNLNAIVGEVATGAVAREDTDHRMADWAKLAQVIARVLGVSDVDTLLRDMKTERSIFALEDEPLAHVLRYWADQDGAADDMAAWRTAAELADKANLLADAGGINLNVSSGRGMGSKLTSLHDELAEVYGLEKREAPGKPNVYRFGRPNAKAKGLGGWS